MKKTFVIIILSLCFIKIYSQNDKAYYAKYVKIHSFGEDSRIDTLNLFFNKQESLFIEIPKKDVEKMKITEDENDDFTLNIRINPPSEGDYVVYTNLKLKKIISRDFIYETGKAVPYIIEESLSRPKWIITNDFKLIGQFNCRKAETTFRGRNYIAWFTERIETTFAPWKLSGLPGLIIEVSDTTNSVKFHLIEFKNQMVYQIDQPKGEDIITLKEYVTLKKEQSDNVIEHLKSKFPRGATFTVKSVKTNPLELSYEWENKG
jgi:GLPGLI family protein